MTESRFIRERVKEQYGRFPYPPIPALALPRPGQGKTLSFELGTELAFGASRSHVGVRILVAGAGTFEPLVVSQAHPRAREITAVDLSDSSLGRLGNRMRLQTLSRWARLGFGPPGAPVTLECADLLEWAPREGFDYILASNVLHHAPDPARLLQRLSSWLKPEGVLRVVTYPKSSRIWMRETSAWLKGQGISSATPRLVRRAREAILNLPSAHPVRSCFESQPEVGTEAGLVDAFLNECENPLWPLQWRNAAAAAGLELVGETQDEGSRSDFLISLVPATARLDAWSRLQVLDDLLELCANPILWFKRGETRPVRLPQGGVFPIRTAELPPRVHEELRSNLGRARALLSEAGVSLEETLEALRRETGPRVHPRDPERILPGLSILDHT